MRTGRGSRGMAPFIPSFGTGLRGVVKYKPCTLIPWSMDGLQMLSGVRAYWRWQTLSIHGGSQILYVPSYNITITQTEPLVVTGPKWFYAHVWTRSKCRLIINKFQKVFFFVQLILYLRHNGLPKFWNYILVYKFLFSRCGPTRVMASLFTRF